MPTTFPLTTYPLDDRTRFKDEHTVKQDMLDDGSMKMRTLGADTYRTLRCVFSPMNATDATTFEAYLRTNRATDFDMVIDAVTYTGYIWSDIKVEPFEGDFYRVSFDFRGKVN